MEKETNLQKERAPHHGENVKRFRKLRGFKQSTFAGMMGYSSKWLCELENKAVIDDELLQQVADLLQVHIDVLKKYTDDCEVQINISGEHVDHSGGYQSTYTTQIDNDVEKIAAVIKPLYEQINEKNLEIYKLMEEIERLKRP